MKNLIKYIIIGVGTSSIVGLVSYGIGYSRGGRYAIEEAEKEFEKIINEVYEETDKHVDTITEIYESSISNIEDRLEKQKQRYAKLFDTLSNDEKKQFIMNNM